LAEGGWLLTASADPPLWDHAPFEVTATPEGILYRPRPGVTHARSNVDDSTGAAIVDHEPWRGATELHAATETLAQEAGKRTEPQEADFSSAAAREVPARFAAAAPDIV